MIKFNHIPKVKAESSQATFHIFKGIPDNAANMAQCIQEVQNWLDDQDIRADLIQALALFYFITNDQHAMLFKLKWC